MCLYIQFVEKDCNFVQLLYITLYIYYDILGVFCPFYGRSKVIGVSNVKGIICILNFVILFMLSGSCLWPGG
jgi:hypothetical protein